MSKVSAAHFNHALPPAPHLSYYFLWPWEESAAGFDFPPFAASLPCFLIIEPNFLLWAFLFLVFDEVHPEYPGFLVPQNADGSEVEGKKAERLFHFEGHFLPGHDGSVQEMLLSVSAINCLLYDSMANSGLEWEGELKNYFFDVCKNLFWWSEHCFHWLDLLIADLISSSSL